MSTSVVAQLAAAIRARTAGYDQPPAPIRLPVVRTPDAVVPPPATPTVIKCAATPTAWRFEIERDADGFLTGILAWPVPLPGAATAGSD